MNISQLLNNEDAEPTAEGLAAFARAQAITWSSGDERNPLVAAAFVLDRKAQAHFLSEGQTFRFRRAQ